MNKIFKVIWSKSKQCYIVVSEIAKNKTGKKKIVVAGIFAALAMVGTMQHAQAVDGPGRREGWPSGVAENGYAKYIGTAFDPKKGLVVGPNMGNDDTTKANGNVATVAIGAHSNASGSSSVAIGGAVVNGAGAIGLGWSTATGDNAVALGGTGTTKANGNNAFAASGGSATGNGAIAIGWQTNAKNDATAVGSNAQATDKDSVAVGKNSNAAGESATAVGSSATASGRGGVAVGWNAESAVNAVGVGFNAKAKANNTVAIGVEANNDNAIDKNYSSVSIGVKTRARAVGSMAMGVSADASGKYSIALGSGDVVNDYTVGTNYPKATGEKAIAIGFNSNALDTNAIAIGSNTLAKDAESIAVGTSNTTAYRGGVALGRNAKAENTAINNVAVGIDVTAGANTNGTADGEAVAVGRNAKANSFRTVAIGSDVSATGSTAVAMGRSANVSNNYGVAVGARVEAGNYGVALGYQAKSTASGALAIGAGNDDTKGMATATTASGGNSVAIGASAKASKTNSVALGSNSITDKDATEQKSTTINSITYNFAGATSDTGMQVSVGAAGKERQIKNVAPGEVSATSTDAINGSQLFAVASQIKPINYVSVKSSAVSNKNNDGATGNDAVAIGPGAQSSGNNGVSLGNGSQANAESVVSIGYQSNLGAQSNSNSIGIGWAAGQQSNGSENVGIGTNAGRKLTGSNNISVGNGAGSGDIYSSGSVLLGKSATIINSTTAIPINDVVAIGNGAQGGAASAVAIGKGAKALGFSTIAIGENSNAKVKVGSAPSVAIGRNTTANGDYAVALGGGDGSGQFQGAKAAGVGTTAIGSATVTKDDTNFQTAVGFGATTDAAEASAFGHQASAIAKNATALGSAASATAENATALGTGAVAKVKDGVAIGSGSKATVDKGVKGYDPNDGRTNKYGGLTNNILTSTNAAVSVGEGASVTRQITGVAAGTNNTDAVNVAQLKSVNLAFSGNSGNNDVNLANGTLAIKGDTTYITTTANTNGITIAGKKQDISVNTNGVASANKGMADAQNVAQSINDAISKNAYTWTVSANGDAGESVAKGNTVDFTGDSNITVDRTGKKITTKLNKDITVDSVKANNKVTVGTAAKQLVLDGTTGAMTAGTGTNAIKLDGTSATITAGSGSNAISLNGTNAQAAFGSGTNAVSINGTTGSVTGKAFTAGSTTINTTGLTSGTGSSAVSFGTNGISAGNQAINNVATGGSKDSNAANIGDVKRYVSGATLNLTDGANHKGSVQLGTESLKVTSGTGINATVSGQTVTIGLTTDAQNAISNGIGLAANSGGTGIKHLKDGDIAFDIKGDGSVVKTTASSSGVTIAVDTDKLAANTNLAYTANGASTAKNVALSKGLNFVNGSNTIAIVNDDGKVSFDLNAATKNQINTNTTGVAANKANIATNAADIATNKNKIVANTTDIATNKGKIATNTTNIAANTTAIARNISLGADTGARSSQSLSTGDVAFNVKGATGDFISTKMNGNTVEVSTKRAQIDSDTNNGTASVTGDDGLATAKNVADAINNAVTKSAYEWKLSANGEANPTTVGKGDIVDFTGGSNITVERDNKNISVKLNKNLTNLSSVSIGNNIGETIKLDGSNGGITADHAEFKDNTGAGTSIDSSGIRINNGITDLTQIGMGTISLDNGSGGNTVVTTSGVTLTDGSNMSEYNAKGIAFGDATGTNTAQFGLEGISAANQQIKDVATGTADTDAVNVKQLKDIVGDQKLNISDGTKNSTVALKNQTLTVTGTGAAKATVNGQTITIDVAKGTLTANADGTATGTAGVADASDVASAINNTNTVLGDKIATNTTNIAHTIALADDAGTSTTAKSLKDGNVSFNIKGDSKFISTAASGNDVTLTVNEQAIKDAAKSASSFKVKANAHAEEEVKGGDTIAFNNGDNIEISQTGKTFTIKTAKNMTVDSLTAGNTVINTTGLTSGTGASAVSFGTNGISAGNQVISNVASGGTTDTNAANIGDVKQAVANLSQNLNITDGTNNGTVDLKNQKLNVAGANGVTANVKNQTITVGLDANTVNATTKGIGLTGDTGSTGNQYLKNGDVSFAVTGDGNLVSTSATTAGVKVAVDAAKVKDLAVAAVTVSKDTQADNPITVTPTAGTNSKDYAIGIDTTKLAAKTDLTYRANSAADANAKKVSLSKGLDFVDGDSTVATVDNDGKVSFDLNTATKNQINTNTTDIAANKGNITKNTAAIVTNTAALARNISLGADAGTASSQSLSAADVAFNVKGVTGDFVSTNMNGNTVEISTKRATINSNATTGEASVTGNDGLATAQNVADAINKAADAAKAGAAWNITTNSSTTDKTAVKGGDTVDLVNGDNIEITQDGTDKKKITVATKKDITVDSVTANNKVTVGSGANKITLDGTDGSVTGKAFTGTTFTGTSFTGTSFTAGNTVINTNGLTNGTTAITGTGVTTDNVTVGGISIDKTTGINAGNKVISNVASGGTTLTNAANIGDVQNAVANLSQNLNITDGTHDGTVDLKNQKLNVAGANGVTATVKDQTITVGLDANTVNATTKGIGLTADTGSTGNKYLKDGDVSFAVTGDGSLVSTSATAAGVKVAVNSATITAGTDGTITGPTTDGVATAKNVADAINAAKKASKTEITANTGEATNATTGNVTLTSTTAADGHTIYDVKLNDKVTLGSGANAVTIDGTAGKATIGSSIVDGVNNTFTTGGAKAVTLNGATGTITGTTANLGVVTVDGTAGTVTGLTNKDWTPGVTKAVSGRAATEDQLQKVADAASSQTWQITADKDTATSGAQTGTKKDAKVGKDDKVQLIAGENLTVNQNERDFTYSLNKDLVKMNSATFEATGGKTTVIKGDSIVQTDGVNVNTSNATSNTITDGTNTSTITAGKAQIGTVGIDGVVSKISTGGTNAVVVNGADGTIKTGNVTVTGGTTNDITGLSNTTLTATDFAAKGRAATEEQLKAATGATTLKFTGDVATNTGSVNLKDDTFGIKGDGKYISTDVNGKNVNLTVSEAEVKKSAVAAVTVSTDTTDANNPLTVTPTTSADGTTKDYKVTIDGTKIANKTNLSYKANDGTAKQVSLADGLNFKNGTLTTASIDDNGVVKYDVNTASITAGTDGTITGPTTDGVATAQNVADAINAAKKASKTEITANTGEAANATTGNVTLTSTTAADGHTIYDVKLNDKVTLGTGANAVTIDGTTGAITGKTATIGGVTVNGTANTIGGLSNTTWNGTATTGRAATEDQLKAVADAASSQTWNITADKAGTTGAQTGTKKNATVGKDETVELVAGDNLTINQDERKFTYSLNKDLAGLTSVSVGTGTTETIKLDGATGKITAKNAAIGGVTIDGDNKHVNGLSNTTWNGTATTGRAATEDQLKAVADTAKTTTDAVNLKFSGNTNTSPGVVNLKDDTFGIVGDGKYVSTDANGKNLTVKVSEAEVKKSAVAAVTVSTDTTDANNPLTVTPTTSADGTTKDYKVTIDGTKIANKTNLSYKANDGTAKQVSLADGLNFKNGTLTTASIDDAGVVKYDVNTAAITAGTDGTITGPTTDGVATAKNVADAINAAKKASKTEITANTGEAANATTGNVTLTSTTSADGHTIYDVKLNDKVTLGSGANAVTIDGTAGKATIGSSVINGVNNTFTTGGAKAVTLDGATGTITGTTANIGGVTVNGTANTIGGLSNTTWNGTATTGRAATEDQLKAVADAAGSQTWEITADKKAGTSGAQTGTKENAKVGKDDKVSLIAGENLTVDQAGKNFTYSLNADLVKMNSATFEATGGKTTVIKGDSIVQTDGTNVNTSNATSNTITDGTNTSTITAGKAQIGTVGIDGVVSKISTGGTNAVVVNGADGTVKTGNVTVTGGTTNDITGLSNTTVTAADFATKGRAATEEQLKAATGATTLKFTGDVATNTGSVNLKDDTFGIKGDNKYISTDVNGKNVNLTVSEAEVKKSAVAAVTVSTDTTDANNPLTVTPTTSADGTTKDYKVTIDGTKIANKTNLSYKANDGAAKQVSLADGLNFKNGTLTTASIDDNGVVKYDVNTASITAGTDGTITGPTTDGVATAQNVADAINAAKKASKTEITANTGEAANATTGNVSLTSTTAADGHTIYDVKLNDKVTLGSGVNAVTIDGTAGKATIGSSIVDGVNNTFTTGGASPVTLNGATGTITGKTANIGGVTVDGTNNHVMGLANKDWTPGVTQAVSGRAATEDQLQKVSDAVGAGWKVNTGKVTGSTGESNGAASTKVASGEEVQFQAGNNLIVDQNGKTVAYSLNKALKDLESATFNGTGTNKTVITGDSITQTAGTQTNTSTAGGNTVADGTKSTETTAAGQVIKDGAKSNKSTVDNNVIDDGNGNVNTSNATSNTITDGTNTTATTSSSVTVKDNAGNSTVITKDNITTGVGGNKITLDGTAGKATVGASVIDGVNNTFTTGGANAVKLDGVAGTIKTGTVTVTGGTTNDITGLSNTTVNSADFATKGRAATEEQLKAVGEQTWQITADKDTATSGAQTGTKKDAKVGKDDKVQLIAGENMTVNQNERDFTYSLNKDLVKMNSATFEATGGKTTVIKGDSIVQTDGTKVNTSTAGGNTVADGTKSTETTADGQVIKDGAKSNKSTVDSNVIDDGNGKVNTSNATSNTITDGTNTSTIIAGKATIGSSIVDGVNNTFTTGGANAVKLDGVAGTIKTGTVTVTGGTTNDITGLSNTTVTAADFATKGRAATEEQLKAVGEQTWQITADKDTATSGAQTGTKKDAKVGKDDKVQLIAGENMTVNQNERDFTFTLNKDLVKMNSATFLGTGTNKTVITGDSITQTAGTQTNTSTAAGNTVADGTKSTETTAAGQVIKDGAKTNTSTVDENTLVDGAKSNKTTVDSNVIDDGTNTSTITAGKATIGSSIIDGVNNTFTTGGASPVTLNGATGTITGKTANIGGVTVDGTNNHVMGLANKDWTPGVTQAVSGRAATEDQLQKVSDAVGAGWKVNTGKVTGSTGESNGATSTKVASGEEVQFQAGNNLIVDQNGKTVAYSLNKALKDLESATFNGTGTNKTVITGDSITQTAGTQTNTSTAGGNTVADGTKSTETTAAGQVIKDGAKTNTSTVDENTIVDGTKSNKSTVDGNTITDGTNTTATTSSSVTVKDNAGNSTVITKDNITTGVGANKVTLDGTAGKATIGSSVIDGVNNTFTTGGANAVKLDGAAGTIKTGTVTVTGGTTNDITGLSNTTVTAADFATKGRAATEEQLKAVGEQTWQITADKDATTSGAQTGTKKDAKVGKDDKVQLIAGENMTVNQNERDFTFTLNKDLVKMNSATFLGTGTNTTVITGDSITQTAGTQTNTSTAGGNTVADGTKSTETTAAGQVIKDGNKSNKSTVDSNVIDDGTGNKNTSNATSNIITDGTNTSTITAGKATIGSSVVDGVNNTFTTGGAHAVKLDGAAGTIKTGTVTVTGGTTNDITGLSNTTVNSADFATKGRAATEEQLKAVGEQTWQITADKDATTSGAQTGTKKDAKVGKDDKVQLIAGENMTVNQNERDFTFTLNKDLVKMNSATFEATGGKTTVIKGDSIVQTDGTKVNTSTAGGNTVVDGTKSTATTADGTTVTSANGNTKYAADGVRINTTGKNPVSLTDAGLDNGNNVIKNVASGHVNNDATDNTNAANIADVKKATTMVTANAGEAANATKGNVTLTSTTAADGHTIYDVKLNDKVTLGTGANAVTIDGTAGKATVGSSVVDGVNNTFTTGGANAVKLDGAAGTIKTGTVTVTGGTTNDITGLSNTTVTAADFATKGRAATEEQLKAVGEQTWQITADKDATTSGAQTGTKKDAKVGKDDKVQLIAGENMTVNQNERDFTFTLNKDLVKMNSATFLGTGTNKTVITGDSITQTAGTQTNTSTAGGNTVADGTKSTETTAAGQVIKDGAKTNTSTVDENTIVDGTKSNKSTVDGNTITDGTNTTATTSSSVTVKDNAGNSTVITKDNITTGVGANKVTLDGTAGKATIGSSVIDGVNNTFTTGGANAVKLDGVAGTIKTGTVTVTGGTTNDITGLSNTTVNSADFATKGRAATEEQLKAVGEQTWQITADKDATTSGAQTGTKKDAKVGKDDKVQLIAGENMTVNQNERDFTFTLNKDLVKMNSATFLGTGSNTTVITGNSITQTAGTQTNTSTAGGNTVADGTKSTETTADGQVIKDGAKSNKSTVDNNVIDDGNGNVNTSNATSNTITDGTNTTATTSSSVTVKDNAGNSTVITKDNITTGVGGNKVTLDGTAGKATIGSSVIDGVNNTFTTGGANAVKLDGAAGTIKTGTVTVTGGTTNDITGLSNTTVTAADFATKGRAATEEQLKAVGEQTWQITADKDATTSGAQTGTKKDAKVGKDDKVQLIAGENMTVNQNERDFTFTLNKDLVKMNSATFLGTGSNTTVITGNSITQTAGTQTNTSTAGGNTVADGTKSTETTAAGQVIKDGNKTNKSTVDSNVIDDGTGNKNTSNATSNTITDGTNTTEVTASTVTVKDNAGNSTVITKDTITTGTGANKVTVDGTAGKVTAGTAVIDGVNNSIITGGANTIKLDGAAGTVTGLTNKTWTPGVTKAVSGRAATEDQLQQVSDAVGAGWKVNTGTVAGSSGVSNGAASTKVSSGEEVKLQAGDNLVIDQNGKTVSYSLNKDLTKMNSATFEATGAKTTVIKGDSIVQTDGGKTNTSNAAGNTVVDGNKSTATTAAGTTITDGAKTNTSTADKNVIDDGAGNTNVSNATSNTLKNAAGDETKADAKGVTVKDAAGNNATFTKDGITITKTGKDTVSLTSNGLDNGKNKIVNVAAGTADTDAVNVSQLKEYAAKSTTELTANGGQPAGSTTGNIVLTKTTAADGHTIYDNKLNDKITLGTDPTKAVTVDGTTGTVTGLTNKTWTPGSIVSGRAATEDQLKEAVADSGWKAAVDKEGSGQSTVVGTSPEKIKAEETVTFKAGNNMMVTQTGKSISYAVNPELTDMKSATFKDAAGNTTVTNGNGITITPGSANPTNPHAGPVSLTKDGLNNGNNQIKGVAPGTDPTDAVNVSQLNASNANTSQAINQIAGEVQHVGAHAAAMAALKPIQYDPLEPTQVMAGVGNYRGETAAALGLAHYTNENTMFNVGVSVGGNHNMVNAGVTHKFGYSPEKKNIPDRYKAGPISSVYVMQDEVSSLKKENAEQKYVIADQAARLTTLEAENEQQRRELAETKKGLDDLKAAVDKLLASKG